MTKQILIYQRRWRARPSLLALSKEMRNLGDVTKSSPPDRNWSGGGAD
ncbi:MAG: hypothetical protein IPG44_10095 [Anaerolineales bacterium]|nr:hypothetical protein [Anaerolineales bacterium]